MSRVGKLPINIPNGVAVTVASGNKVVVKGPLGELSQVVSKKIKIVQEDNKIRLERLQGDKDSRAMHGLYRKLIFNMVEGVVKPFEIGLVLNGVGYRATKDGNGVTLNIGYSHPCKVMPPEGVKIDVISQTELKVSGISKEAVGQVAANIKRLRIPDPYHAYGIRYKDEEIARKEGKKAGK